MITHTQLCRPLAGFAAAVLSFAAWSQDTPPAVPDDDKAQKKTTQLEQVTVTGSRIPRASVEGPAPVTVIQGKDLDAMGYRNAFDAMSAVTQNTGSVQGEDFGSTFTPAANVISLRGLGPNHTLVLVDGRRIADYPVAYNGSVNTVNLANIPSVMIERIEILSGNASAIYGSDAIAGVVNIVLKKKVVGTDLSARFGGTQEGGGDNQRLQLSTGQHWGKLDALFAVELSNREPIRYGDRELSNSYSRDALPGQSVPAIASVSDPTTSNYFDPPNGCGALSGLQGGSVVPITPSGSTGSYCSSDRYYNNRTIQTRRKAATGYAKLDYDLSDNAQLFGNFTYGYADVDTNVRAPSWSLPSGAFWNDKTGRLESWSRVLTPEETGSVNASNYTYDEYSWNAVAGIRGDFDASAWHYEAAYNRSADTSNQGRRRFLAGLDNIFLGPQTGTHPITVDNGDGTSTTYNYASYNADSTRLFTPFTPTQYGALSARSVNHDTAYTQDLSFTLNNGNVLQLPAGPLGVAGVVEAGNQNYRIHNDPRINQGAYWNTTQASNSSGDRNRYAVAVEANVPLLAGLPLVSSLTATLAGRYDDYHISGGGNSRSTYNLGLEYRPVETLLVRGTYATAFRAPDMNYLFDQGTTGYYPSQTDYYECRLSGQPANVSCSDAYNMNYHQTGNRHLAPETATSFTYGLVWSPSSHFDFQADYYRVSIKNEVADLSADRILQQEADCRFGKTVSGTPVDPNSAVCVDALSRVDRNPSNAPASPNMVQNIHVNPINASGESTAGVDLSGNVRWDGGRYGRYTLHLAHTQVLNHRYQQFAGDPTVDYLNDVSQQLDWRAKTQGNVSWRLGPWSAMVEGERYSSIPNNAYTGRRDIYAVANVSGSYVFNKRLKLSLIVNNVADTYPEDKTGGWPNYSAGWYDEYGRQWWVQLDYHLGPGGNT